MTEIRHYRIHYLSEPDNPWTAEILCFGLEEGDYFPMGYIRFFEDPTAVPANSWVGGVPEGKPIVNFPLSRFADVVGMLRDESYVALGKWTNEGWGFVTYLDPTGEMKPKP